MKNQGFCKGDYPKTECIDASSMISNYTCARVSVNDDNLTHFQGDKFSLKFILMGSSWVGTAQRSDVLATPDLEWGYTIEK